MVPFVVSVKNLFLLIFRCAMKTENEPRVAG